MNTDFSRLRLRLCRIVGSEGGWCPHVEVTILGWKRLGAKTAKGRRRLGRLVGAVGVVLPARWAPSQPASPHVALDVVHERAGTSRVPRALVAALVAHVEEVRDGLGHDDTGGVVKAWKMISSDILWQLFLMAKSPRSFEEQRVQKILSADAAARLIHLHVGYEEAAAAAASKLSLSSAEGIFALESHFFCSS